MQLRLGVLLCAAFAAQSAKAQQTPATAIDLPSSKQLQLPAPGQPQRINGLPMAFAASPDGRWIVSLDAGYGTWESNYSQSLSVLNTGTGEVKDFPDDRTREHAAQTFFSGLAFSADGKRVYASLASSTDPEGKGPDATGNGIVVYDFSDGALKPKTFLALPLVPLAAGRHTDYRKEDDGRFGIPYPAAIAVLGGDHEQLLVAENLSDSVVLMDARSGHIERTIDLSDSPYIPSAYPIALAVTHDGTRAFVALWNDSEVVELDLLRGVMTRRIALMKPRSPTAPGTHPCALQLDERAGLLYVALANRDAIAAIEIGKSRKDLAVRGYFDARLPGQSYFGAEPDALAESSDGTRLYAANMGSDAVAVFDAKKLRSMAKAKGMVEPVGFVPTEWMPTALISSGGNLYIATGKGKGTGPNNTLQKPLATDKAKRHANGGYTYIPTLLYGSLAVLKEAELETSLKSATEVVLESNRMKAAHETIQFQNGSSSIKHVIYIIKENRTYDQVFGDLKKDGKPVGNGDPKLTLYGQSITPNQHQLALQFGVLDNFFDSAEVSADGHVWSTAGIGTDYLEKTWVGNYRGKQRTYDYEGMVADGYPILQHIPDVNEPSSGYLWTNFASHGKTIYHFGEYISSVFCKEGMDAKRSNDPRQGAMSGSDIVCKEPYVQPGGAIPAEWGGGKNLWPWAIPRLEKNIPTKPELVGHFAAEAPDWNLRVPDVLRANVFMRHLEQWKQDRAAGTDTMPNFILLRLGNDHTGGTTPGGPTPRASVADNDLAIGRVVDAVSHSAFWDDTAFFILEDDAQNGADHVDAHRSLALVISKYAPHANTGQPAFVDSRFYSTVSVLRTMETLLGVPPMNNNDALSSLISSLFTGPGDQPPFSADESNRENGLIYKANEATAVGAAASSKMDFTHADRADENKLNLILWQDAMGSTPPPSSLLEKHRTKKDDDDD